MSLQRRLANRWSGRLAYTLGRARDARRPVQCGNIVETRVNNDLNPRLDYGLASHNRHAFTSGGNWDVWRGLGLGPHSGTIPATR